MKQEIEVEVRGPLSAQKYAEMKDFFEKNAKLTEDKKRLFIDYSTFLPGEGIRERKKDVRVRVTNGIPEIVVKIGSWGGSDSRKELSFKGKEGDFGTLVEIFGQLGFEKGIMAVRNTIAYEYKGIEIALVEVPGHSYFFEAEKMANEGDDFEKVKQEILDVCKEFNLSYWTQEEFFSYIEVLNKEANGIFEFKDYKPDFFKEKFGF